MTSPVLAVEVTGADGEKHRVYRHPLTGEQVPSITSVIHVLNKPRLVNWAARMAAEYAVVNWSKLGEIPVQERVREIKAAHERYTGKAQKTGDIVHDLIDAWSTGKAFPEYPREVNSFANQFIGFLMDNRPKFIENEFTVWSRKHQYAGTGDWIAAIGGHVFLGDTKTGRSLWPEVGLQLAALSGADFILRPDGSEEPIPQIDGLAALHIRPRSWKLQPVYEQGENFAAFLAARRLLHWQHQTAPNVLIGEL